MLGMMNFSEIISGYFKEMRKNLKPFPFFTNIVFLPIVMALIFYFLVKDFKEFAKVLIIVSSIFILSLINLLVILYHSIGTLKNSKAELPTRLFEMRLEFLRHITIILFMTILNSIFVLFVSIIIVSTEGLVFMLKALLIPLTSFMFVNFIITLNRLYKLIKLFLLK